MDKELGLGYSVYREEEKMGLRSTKWMCCMVLLATGCGEQGHDKLTSGSLEPAGAVAAAVTTPPECGPNTVSVADYNVLEPKSETGVVSVGTTTFNYGSTGRRWGTRESLANSCGVTIVDYGTQKEVSTVAILATPGVAYRFTTTTKYADQIDGNGRGVENWTATQFVEVYRNGGWVIKSGSAKDTSGKQILTGGDDRLRWKRPYQDRDAFLGVDPTPGR